MVIYGRLSLSCALGGEHFMELRGPLEWVRCGSKTRHITAIFSHIRLRDTEPNRKVHFAGKMSPNYMGRTSTGGEARSQVLPKPRQVTQVLGWPRTQVAFGSCRPTVST